MFVLHQGNQLEHLASRLTDVLRAPLPTPLTPDIVVVQSIGMKRWVSLWLATECGLCANVEFPFPASFVWDVFRSVLGPLPTAQGFDPSMTSWHLFHLLEQIGAEPVYAPLRTYLADADDRRRWELARHIADVFDQYLVYRPDFIQEWERGDGDDWQALLWRQLIARVGSAHRVHLWEAFRTRRLSAADCARLPPRLALFGIPSMPPLYLDVFAHLAQVIDVHCFVLNPCGESWSDLRRADALHSDAGHPLLASLGRQGREFLDQLAAYEPHEEDHFVAPLGASLLAQVQRDIFTLTDPPPVPPPAALTADRSLQVHVCHSPTRELEVLHDQLLLLFDAHPDVPPARVVVMTPDIDAYAAAIDAVFGTVPRERFIPYTIADRRLQHESPLVEAFLELLALPRARFEAARVLALLSVPAIRRRFGMSAGDVARVRTWVRAVGVRWGMDEAGRTAVGAPRTDEHTWRFGLDRLLLGYAVGDVEHDPLRDHLVAHADIDADEAPLLGRLHTFVDALAAVGHTLDRPRPPAAWSQALRQLLDDSFRADDTEERDLYALRSAITQIESTATAAAYAQPISLELVTTQIREALDVPGGAARFLAGGVTFCALMPMRSIPFAVVCLIGMNEGSVPRSSRPLSFDRMAEHRRRGDRSRRDDDRYLFLEALCSARECFYVSYVGRDIHDNTALPPSILVSELTDYVTSRLGADVVTQHPLQSFSPRYFDGRNPRLVSHAPELCLASGFIGRTTGSATPFVPHRLPPPDAEWRTVSVARLVQFFSHPSRFFLHERLGVRLDTVDAQIESREPFVLNGLERYGVRQELLAVERRGADVAVATRSLRGRGLLPHGTVGDVVVDAEWGAVRDFGQRLAVLEALTSRPSAVVDLDLAGVRIVGTVDGLTSAGRIAHRFARTRATDQVGLWVTHLVLQLIASPEVPPRSRWLASDGEFVLTPVVDASTQLAALVRLYCEGLERPLPLFPACAWDFVNTPKRPWGAARDRWEGNEYLIGEGEDPYHALVFRDRDPLDDEFARLAATMFGPWAEHCEAV